MKTRYKAVKFSLSVLLLVSMLLASHLTPALAVDTVTNSKLFLPVISYSQERIDSLHFDAPDSTVEPNSLEQDLISHLKASQVPASQAVDTFLAQNKDRVKQEMSSRLHVLPIAQTNHTKSMDFVNTPWVMARMYSLPKTVFSLSPKQYKKMQEMF